MLGLGRAIGETIAATLVIGNAPEIGDSIFSQGYTLAAVIANEFGEAASDPLHRAALIAAGLVLFVLTLVRQRARPLLRRARRAQAGRRRPEGDGRMSAHAGPIIAPVSARRRRTDTIVRGRAAGGDADRARPARASSSTTCSRRASGAISWDFFTTDPTGRFLGDPGGIKSAIIGTIVIVALATRDRDPARRRRRALPRRVRQEVGVRQRRPLLHRRDDRRAVDRLRPVHLHRARAQRLRRQLRRLEGLDRARAADAAGRHALVRGRAEARAEHAARGRARARRAALARDLQGRAADGAARASSPARCWRSRAARARRRRCCSPRSRSTPRRGTSASR